MVSGVSHIHNQDFIPLAEALLSSSKPAALFDDYRKRDRYTENKHEVNSLHETLIAAVVDCLNHKEYEISSSAAIVLRENIILCSRACNMDTIVSSLSDQVNERRIKPSKEAASALAFFLSTRPRTRNLPQWHGSDPMSSSTISEDIDDHRFGGGGPIEPGYLHEIEPDIVESAIDALISNLDRKEYKRSSDWVVAKECAKALGAIGYQRPEIVSDAVPELQQLLNSQDTRQGWLVYALTSIGYSRPDLLDDSLKTPT